MTKYYYDLHIHSALSPCADDDMSLHNIINMAKIKELDIIAITDHNTSRNVEPFLECVKDTDLLAIPGIEVETYEGIHMLCYFKSFKALKLFSRIVYRNLPHVNNKESLCGKQLILNHHDEVIGKEIKMLMNSTKLKINSLINLVHLCDGLTVAAHINRYANSILTVLGFIPSHYKIDGIELYGQQSMSKQIHEVTKKYRVITNSDAHSLGDICEKLNYLELPEKSVDAFFSYFRGAS